MFLIPLQKLTLLGTTQNHTDGWFMGVVPNLATEDEPSLGQILKESLETKHKKNHL